LSSKVVQNSGSLSNAKLDGSTPTTASGWPSIRGDVNTTYLQPFANYNLGSGLSAGVSMEATGNWEADEAWTAPLLFNVSKVALLGKRPVSFAVAAGPTIREPGRRSRVAISTAGDIPVSTVTWPGTTGSNARRARESGTMQRVPAV
jgi:type IV secretory pathway VirB10-like protein